MRLSGNSIEAVPSVLQMLRSQRHRGRQGAGLAVLTAPSSAGFSVLKFDGNDSLDRLCDSAMPLGQLCQALKGSTAIGHVRYATNGLAGTEAVHPFVSPDGQVALCGNFHFGCRYEAPDGNLITRKIAEALASTGSHQEALRLTLADARGGFVLCGITADGSAFAVRDRHGIRPAWYALDERGLRVASERHALHAANACPLPPGHALIMDADGSLSLVRIMEPAPLCQCPFESIYFASAEDPDIAATRRNLGRALSTQVLQVIDGEELPPLITYVPHSAVHAWQGLADALGDSVIPADIISKTTRHRTFMHVADGRTDEVRQAYTIDVGKINNCDGVKGRAVIIVDDSIVRGTTFRQSTLLSDFQALGASRIIIVSSAPPVLFPDFYGIDIPTRAELVAAQAADSGLSVPCLITPQSVTIPVSVIYQTVTDLQRVLGPDFGTWVFTGNYPD